MLEGIFISYLISILASMTAKGIGEIGEAVSKKTADRKAALLDRVQEFKEKGDWRRLIEEAWA